MASISGLVAIIKDAAPDQILPNLPIERGHRYELAAQFFTLVRHHSSEPTLLLLAEQLDPPRMAVNYTSWASVSKLWERALRATPRRRP